MRNENKNNEVFNRRVFLFGGIKTGLVSLLIGRLYFLQVIESEDYSVLSDENRINLRLLPPPRGRILDRYDNELAGNQRNYRVILIPEQTNSVTKTLETLSKIYKLSPYEKNKIIREVKRHRSFVPVTVAENLSWENFSRINIHAPDLPGIQSEIGESRFYYNGNAFAHLIGYVGVVSKKDLTGEPLLELPGFRVGKSGIEYSFEKKLRGKAGISRVEVNAYGRVIREINRKQGDPGTDVKLTIDSRLQEFVSKRLGRESASVVVMNINNGDILSLVSTPSFNPSSFNVGISNYEWESLLSNPKNPLLNKAIGGQYPPGSTFKMIVAIAALENNVINDFHKINCEGHIDLGGEKFHCWKEKGHGETTLLKAIEQSCDIFFYDIARKIGIDKIAEVALKFGLGSKTGIEIPSEISGNVPDTKWKKRVIGNTWQQGETLHAGIGQGYVLATPLQLAVMMARLTNGGREVVPKVIYSSKIKELKSLEISQKTLNIISKGMYMVCNSSMGTAFKYRLNNSKWNYIGKTGTSQVRRISQIERETRVLKNYERPWVERDHALFVASVPVKSPIYSVSVVVEHGGSGSSTAAPIARDIIKELGIIHETNLKA
ncbi:penicillin-binding protein 2 [Alphaproteobacteria bacterium]|nr:penicillin-binding protein 2 [Alphaproteobacteria bacterium]